MEPQINWVEYFGCMGFFNMANGIFEIIDQSRVVKLSDNSSPIFMVIGKKEGWIQITHNGTSVAEIKTENVRILNPLLK